MAIGWHELEAALGLGDRALVSFVGGGGKTTAVFALGRHRAGRTIITTTTKMGVDRTGGRPVVVGAGDAELARALDDYGCVLAWSRVDDHRAVGVTPEVCDRWATFADTVAVEADGSRRKPFKAPRDHEPVIPSTSSHVVACVGMAAIGAPIVDGCQRPELVAALADCGPTDVLTPQRLATVLLAPTGSRKGVPVSAAFSVLLNRVRDPDTVVVDELTERLAIADVPLIPIADLPADQLPDSG